MINCILAGVGGQGTVLASKLIAQAAMDQGLTVRTAETIGMAQRGGCVVSHLRIGNVIHSSMVPMGEADVILAFEPGEGVRCLPYLKKDGTVIVSSKPVQPVTASLSGQAYDAEAMLKVLHDSGCRLVVVDTQTICEQCGSMKVLNVVLLGAAAQTGVLGLTVENFEAAIAKRVKEKFLTLNQTALRCGAKAAQMRE